MLRVNNLSGFGRIVPVGGGGDADVAAFISATGISDGTIESALETLVTSLKADGIWSKCVAIYPFVGGSSTTHSYNLKDTSSYQITWSGTITHDSNGITGNGTTGYGDTGINASSVLTANDNHLSFYCRTTGGNENRMDMGASEDAGDTDRFALFARYFNFARITAYRTTTANAGYVQVTNSTSAQGFWMGTRRTSTALELYQNGSSLATGTSSVEGALPNSNIFICALNSGTAAISHSNRNYAFATVGAGLTDTEVSNCHTAIEAFQDALSRGVV